MQIRFHFDNAFSFLERFLGEEFNERLLDFVPPDLLTSPRLGHLPEMEKLRLLIHNATELAKADQPSDAILNLKMASEVGIQLVSLTRGKIVQGASLPELIADAKAKRLIGKHSISSLESLVKVDQDFTATATFDKTSFLQLTSTLKNHLR